MIVLCAYTVPTLGILHFDRDKSWTL